MKQLKVSLFFTLIFASTLFAQKSLRDGFIVTNSGDTSFGKIRERDWNLNPTKIEFEKGITKTYEIADIKSFGLTGGDTYRRNTVSLHRIPYAENNSYPAGDIKIDSVTAWLKLIVSAKKSLAVLYLPERPYFYVLEQDGTATELVYGIGLYSFSEKKHEKDSRYGTTSILETTEYKTQLYSFFPDEKSFKQIDQTLYKESSLGKLFNRLNNVQQSPNNGKRLVIFAVSGGASSFASNINAAESGSLENASLKNALTPFGNIAFHFINQRRRERSSFIIGIGFTSFNTTGTQFTSLTSSTISIKNLMLEPFATTRYIFNPEQKQKLYAEAGLNALLRLSGGNKTITKNNTGTSTIEKEGPAQKTFIVAPSLSLGCLFTRNIGLSLNYQYLHNLSNVANTNWQVNRFSAAVTYSFRK